MRKLLPLVALVLASCASQPPAPPAREAAPPPVAAAPVTYEVALPVSVKSYYPNGDLSGSIITKYDAVGNLLRQENYNGNGILIEVRSGKAKGDAWRISTTNDQTKEVLGFEDKVLGPNGELLIQTFLNSKEVVQASNEYTYDAQGRRVQWLAKTGSGGLQARTAYLYDAKGNNTRTELYDAAGSLTNYFESTYEDDRIVSRRGFDATAILVEQTNFTWKDGRKVKEETVKPILRVIEYSYGDKSAPAGIVSYVRGKFVERQTLEYQWITKTKVNR